MKKIVASAIVIMALASYTAKAQFYVRAGLGYALPAAGQTLSGDGTYYSSSAANVNSYNLKSASFSAGGQGVLGIGYMFSQNVGVQLDGNLGVAPKKYTYGIDSVNVNGVLSSVKYESQAAHTFMLMPSLVLQSSGSDLQAYCRLGFVLPLSTAVTQDRIFANLPGTGSATIQDEEWKISSNFSLGYTAAAGVNYKLNDKVSIWGELSIVSLSVFVKEEYFSSVTVDGQAINLANYPNVPRTINYSKSGSIDSVHNPTFSQPFSSVGINFGVKFRLSDDAPKRSKTAKTRTSSGRKERGYYE